jgi:hypothetical protein
VDAIRWPKAASGVREHRQLKDRFKKSLSMSGELGSLAGDRVVSHERSRPAELARRQDLRSRRAGPYPSHSCGCLSWYALLAGDHRCREAVTARGANSIDAFEAGNQLLRRVRPSRMIPRCGQSLGRFLRRSRRAHHFIQDRHNIGKVALTPVEVRPRPLSPQIDQALTRQPCRRQPEPRRVPGEATGPRRTPA